MRMRCRCVASVVCALLATTAMGQGSEAERSAGSKPLNPSTACVLGGALGLGSGYYYSHSYAKGAVFTVIDFFTIGTLIGSASDWDAFGVGQTLTGLSGAVLAISHVVQAVDAPADARRYNRKHPVGLLGSPVGLSFGPSWNGDVGSVALDDLWAEGGASRDLAVSMERLRRERPPLEVRFEADSPGVMLSWSSAF